MAKKKKKGLARKKRAASKQKLAGMSGEQLVQRAVHRIGSGKIREGIDAYKQALKNGGDPAEVLPGLFKAYYLRFKALDAKNMAGEAKAVRDMGGQVMGQIPHPDADTLGIAALFLPVGDVINSYVDYLTRNGPVADIERMIGSRLVMENCIRLADQFDDSSLLKLDAKMVAGSRAAMDSGKWALAFRQMRKVSLKSPYADVKVFAKAMTAFGRGDRPSLKAALERISGEFPLKTAIAVLNDWANDEPVDSQGKTSRTAALLMGDAIRKHGYRKNLEDAANKSDVPGTIKWIKSLAGLLGFKSRKTGISGILEIIGAGRSDTRMSVNVFKKIVKGTLSSPEDRDVVFNKALSLKEGFVSFNTTEYLYALGWEFRDERDRKSALSVILTELILVLENNMDLFWDRDEALEDIFDFLGMSIDPLDEEEEIILLRLAQRAAQEDPENKDAWDRILKMPETTVEMRKALVPSLEAMMGIHGHDHRPCLKLARLFYKKNAYRKAEKALAEAYNRAPHDLVVKEEYALSFLVAAAGNLKRRKNDLAQRDLDKAYGFNVPGLKIFIAEKKLVALALQGEGFSRRKFEHQTQGFSPCEKMAVLLLFKLDARDSGFKPSIKTRGVDTVFKFLKKQLDQLDSDQVLSLVKPLEHTYARLYHYPFFAGPLMGKRGQLLDGLDDKALLNLMVALAEYGYKAPVLRQLAKRGKKKDTPLKTVLDFCHAAFEYMDGTQSAGKRLYDIAEEADDRLRARLKKISKDFVHIAPDYRKEEFSSFDFSMGRGWFYEADDDWDEDDDWGPELGGGISKELAGVMDKFMKEMMGTPERPGRVTEDKKDPLDIDPFDPATVFKKGQINKNLALSCESLTKAAMAIIDGEKGMRDQFQGDMDRFMLAVGASGPVSKGEFREAGRKFALAYAPAKQILEAMDMCRAFVDGTNAMHFIMGMRTGV